MYSLIGKVAADHSHKWIYKEPNDQEINFLSAWHNAADSVIISLYVLKIHFMLHFLSGKKRLFSYRNIHLVLQHPRTWEAQFQSGIKV